ncbi:hypothetical protein A3765_28570 [Oleiphilus sp. HI0130]|nr:hypothetical protein A3765_28855 [Oleiphilus sp. HI0130]KZZ72507.1 hypothetical protein A3765_28570 [Oleiphilus sp. HI0130]
MMLKKKMLAQAVIAASMAIYGHDYPRTRRKEAGFDIEEEYELIQQKKSKLSANYGHDYPRTRRKEAGFDIEEEYELIQQKKSKLSANQRRRVVLQIERKNDPDWDV